MNTIQAWIHDHFPGHDNAFIGGVCGLLTAMLFFDNLGYCRCSYRPDIRWCRNAHYKVSRVLF